MLEIEKDGDGYMEDARAICHELMAQKIDRSHYS